MDHIWGAPSGVKKSIIFIFWEKKAVTFGPQFPKTLYSVFIFYWLISRSLLLPVLMRSQSPAPLYFRIWMPPG